MVLDEEVVAEKEREQAAQTAVKTDEAMEQKSGLLEVVLDEQAGMRAACMARGLKHDGMVREALKLVLAWAEQER